jgi:hypothetical protein
MSLSCCQRTKTLTQVQSEDAMCLCDRQHNRVAHSIVQTKGTPALCALYQEDALINKPPSLIQAAHTSYSFNSHSQNTCPAQTIEHMQHSKQNPLMTCRAHISIHPNIQHQTHCHLKSYGCKAHEDKMRRGTAHDVLHATCRKVSS